MNKPLQNIERNKSANFGVSAAEVKKQTHLEKTDFKDMHCIWNLQW